MHKGKELSMRLLSAKVIGVLVVATVLTPISKILLASMQYINCNTSKDGDVCNLNTTNFKIMTIFGQVISMHSLAQLPPCQ